MTECPTGCGRKVRPGHLMCGTCWSEVPRELQRDVLSTWRKLSAERHRRPRDMDTWGEALAAYESAKDAALGSIR